MKSLKTYYLSASSPHSSTSGGKGMADRKDPVPTEDQAQPETSDTPRTNSSSPTPRSNQSGIYQPSTNSSGLLVSRPGHLSVQSDSQSSVFADLKADVTVASLYQDQRRNLYVADWNTGEGVVLKRSRNAYICQPPQLREHPGGFFDMASLLNVSVSSISPLVSVV